MVQRISDTLASQVAVSAQFDPASISDAGAYAVYQNHRYLIARRDGRWIGWDISVYDDSNRLVTDSTDVYLNILRDLPGDVAKGARDTALLIGAAVIAFLWFTRK